MGEWLKNNPVTRAFFSLLARLGRMMEKTLPARGTAAGILLSVSLLSPAQATLPNKPMPDACKEWNGQVHFARCGWAHEQGNGRPQDYQTALEMYRKAAEKGDPYGQDLLGRLYRDGHGVPQDAAEAAKWFRKAADQMSNEAKADLGNLYAEGGKNFAPDYEEAYFWLSLPHWPHDGDFARLSDGRIVNPARNFDAPCTEAALQKARKHLTKEQIIAIRTRVDTWKPPPGAADELGDCNFNGNGARRKDKAEWCFKAARQGNVRAQMGLGGMFNTGDVAGIKKDWAEAYFWWSVAVRNISPDEEEVMVGAMTGTLEMAARKLTPEQKAAVDKRVLEWKPE